jgi:hypothetical protein
MDGYLLCCFTSITHRPSDTTIPAPALEEIITCINAEHDNPQFLVSLFAKFSRKLVEPNVFTQIKALIAVHKIMENVADKAQPSIAQCVKSLRQEEDGKSGVLFFSTDSIDQSRNGASTVGQLETVELAREYAIYVFDYIDAKGDRTKIKEGSVDRAELLLNIIDQGVTVEELCEGASEGSKVSKLCLDSIKEDRDWALKQLQKLFEVR